MLYYNYRLRIVAHRLFKLSRHRFTTLHNRNITVYATAINCMLWGILLRMNHLQKLSLISLVFGLPSLAVSLYAELCSRLQQTVYRLCRQKNVGYNSQTLPPWCLAYMRVDQCNCHCVQKLYLWVYTPPCWTYLAYTYSLSWFMHTIYGILYYSKGSIQDFTVLWCIADCRAA